MKEQCENKSCSNDLNSTDKKRIYIFDELVGDEVPVFVCDECYKKNKEEENNIDWDHSV